MSMRGHVGVRHATLARVDSMHDFVHFLYLFLYEILLVGDFL